VIGATSIFKLIRKPGTFVRARPTLLLNCETKAGSGTDHDHHGTEVELLKLQKRGQFPDEPVKIKV
jgi:hypothetical protein